MSVLRNLAVVSTAALVGLLAANGVAFAATGHGVLLGHANSSAGATGLTRTGPGPALALKVRAGSAPLTVSSDRLVKHLNADAVDGQSARALQTRATRYVVAPLDAPTTRVVLALDGVRHGLYQASFNIAATTSASGTRVNCYLSTDLDQTSGDSQLLAYGSDFLGFSTTNSSGFVDYRHGPGLALTCFAGSGQSFNFTQGQAVVTLVPLDALSVRPGALTPVRPHRGASTAQGR